MCYHSGMAAYVPPGWPAGVHPPGSEDFERTAVAWLLDVVPADYRLYGVLRRYPLAIRAARKLPYPNDSTLSNTLSNNCGPRAGPTPGGAGPPR